MRTKFMFTNEVKCASCSTRYDDKSEIKQSRGDKAPACPYCGKDTVLVINPGIQEV